MNRVRPNAFTEAHERVEGRGEKCGENEDMMKFDETRGVCEKGVAVHDVGT